MPSVKVIVYTRPGNVMENDTHTLKNLRDRQNYVYANTHELAVLAFTQ